MDRVLRGELFFAHAIGHVSTPQSILREFPEAARGCPEEDARMCIFDEHAAQRALLWAVSDCQTLVSTFLIAECGARVDEPSPLGITPLSLAAASSNLRIREIVDDAYSEIRMHEIVKHMSGRQFM